MFSYIFSHFHIKLFPVVPQKIKGDQEKKKIISYIMLKEINRIGKTVTQKDGFASF